MVIIPNSDNQANVGIGTSAPDNTLMVQGASTTGAGSTGNVALFEGPSGTNGLKIFIDDTENAAGLQTIASDDLLLNPHGGSVGIGTTSPSNTLEVNGNIAVNTSSGNNGIKIITGNTAEGFLIFGDAQDNSMGGMSYNNSTNSLSIDCNNSEAISIDSSQRVGIGETSPQNPLHVRSDSASGENYAIQIDNNNTTVGSQIGMLFRSRVGNTNTDFSIRGIANGTDDMDLTFNSDGGSERLRITKDGNVGIGTSFTS